MHNRVDLTENRVFNRNTLRKKLEGTCHRCGKTILNKRKTLCHICDKVISDDYNNAAFFNQ